MSAPLIVVVYDRPPGVPRWLVNDLRTNLGWADRFVEVPIVGPRLYRNETPFGPEQRAAVERARVPYGSWIIVASVYDRWSLRARKHLRRLASRRGREVVSFPIRELWGPDLYRVDGPWGTARRARMFRYLKRQRFARNNYANPVPVWKGYPRLHVPEVPIYRLDSIHPAGRRDRAMVAEALWPGSVHRCHESLDWALRDPWQEYAAAHGYAYLADPRGRQLRLVNPRDMRPYAQRQHIPITPHAAWLRAGTTRERMEQWLDTALARPKGRRP